MNLLSAFRVLKFIVAGLFNTAIGLSVIYMSMFFWGVNPLLSNAIGYGIGFSIGYFLNKKWIFKSHGKSKSSFAMYLFVIAIAYAVNTGSVYVGIYYLGINMYGAQLLGMISYAVISYIGFKVFVFN
ncbi:MAG: GtrA family protein [Rhodoferax sp.]|nr:GtrA family protein [Rhodoferax sp.]